MANHVERRGDVAQREFAFDLHHVAAGPLDVARPVAGGDVAADAVIERGRDRHESGRCILIDERTDMGVDAEDLLQDHHGATRPGRRRREIGIELVPVAGHQRLPCAHGVRAR